MVDTLGACSNQLFEVLEEWNVQLSAMEAEFGPLRLEPDDPGDDDPGDGPELSGPGGQA